MGLRATLRKHRASPEQSESPTASALSLLRVARALTPFSFPGHGSPKPGPECPSHRTLPSTTPASFRAHGWCTVLPQALPAPAAICSLAAGLSHAEHACQASSLPCCHPHITLGNPSCSSFGSDANILILSGPTKTVRLPN